jgi:hypothetical protein
MSAQVVQVTGGGRLYACGHEIEGYDAMPETQRTWKRGRLCVDCFKASAYDQDLAAGLPALTGTEKQIQWAAALRWKLIREAEDALMRNISVYGSDLAFEAKVRRLALELLKRQTDSSFWINGRDRHGYKLLVRMMYEARPILLLEREEPARLVRGRVGLCLN